MVLRGSNITPESSLGEVVEGLNVAQERLSLAQEELDIIHKSSVEDLLKKIESKETDRAELIAISGEIKSRISLLEKKQSQAWWEVISKQEAIDRTLRQLACGGLAGAIARSTVAPLDRVKILIQTASVTGTTDKFNSILGTARYVIKSEGLGGLWRGNLTNCVRVVPHTAVQFVSYDKYKALIVDGDKPMTIPQRLLAGALSGMTAATVTHPMDVVRINLQTRPELGGAMSVAREIYRVGGIKGFYKGYTPAMLSLSPFIAVNFAAFDTLKSFAFGDKKMTKKELQKRNPFIILGLGAASGIIAQTACYPLDTVRRRMQLMNRTYTSTANAFYTIATKEGFTGFYRGMVPNALKVVPNNALRFAVYEVLKSYFVPEGGPEVDIPSGG